MAREEVIRLAFEADLSDLRKELGKLPEIGTKEAKSMVKALEKQYKRAERAAKKTAKAQKDASGKVKAGFEAAKQAATGFGGAIGGVGGQVEAFTRSLLEASAAIGPAGVAIIGAGLAVAGLGIAAFKASEFVIGLIGEAEDLAKSLEPFSDAGIFAPVPDETIDSIKSFNDSMDGLLTVATAVKVEFAGELATSLKDVVEILLAASLAAKAFSERIGGIGAAARTAGLFLEALGTQVLPGFQVGLIGTKIALAGASSATEEYKDKAKKLTDTIREEKEEQEKETKAVEGSTDAKRAQAEQEKANALAMKASLAAIRETEKARDSLAAIMESTTADLLTDEQKIQAAFEDRVDAIADVMMASKDTAAVKAALDAAEERRIRELGELDDARITQQKQSLNELAALERQLGEQSKEIREAAAKDALMAADAAASAIASDIGTLARLREDAIIDNFENYSESIEKEGRKRRRVQEEEIAGLLASGQISEAEAKRRLDNIDDLEEADSKKIRKLKKISDAAVLKSFKTQKASQKALAIIDAARAAMTLTGSMSYLGPLAPAVAAGIAAAGLGIQLAVINAQSPPEFPIGGPVGDRLGSTSVDHVPIMAMPTEGIVTPRGMDDLGRDGLERINGGSGSAPNISIQVGPDVVARMVMSSPDLAGKIAAEFKAVMSITSGRVPVYGKG